MNFRPFILPLVLLAGLGMVFALPKAGETADSAIRMTLPEEVGYWGLAVIPPSKEEVEILGSETDFAKAACLTPRPGEYGPDGRPVPDRIELSIVLSGTDLNQSIHRPERCMPAQGHGNLRGSDLILKLPNGRDLGVRRLLSTQTFTDRATGKVLAEIQCLTYYFFVGNNRIVHGHYARTFADMADRLFLGMDQRWAYVTVSTWYGNLPWLDNPITEAEADTRLSSFLGEFAVQQIDWDRVR
jgi:hypothetical protein